MSRPSFVTKPEGTATVSLDDWCPCHDGDGRCLNCTPREFSLCHGCVLQWRAEHLEEEDVD